MKQPDGTYEALDTKLARSAKPAYILQLLFYNEQLARIQGREPEHIHVLLGNGEQQTFRPSEFAAYYRRVRSRLERFVADPPPTEPYPVDHCRICDFKPICDAYWDSVDHLSRVAGVYRTQIERLEAAGITTLAAARARARRARPGRDQPRPLGEEPRAGRAPAPRARDAAEDIYRLIEPQPEAGFALLPDPSPGDLFFDFEGNPFWDADGSLEYLWGILDVDGNFTPLHAHDHETERIAFEPFVDLVHERLARYPDLHVYHYAPYEITALKRLMGRYGTRERELDDLLRREVFVDLYRVVRNGVRASRPGYGLKELEAFLDFERQAEVKDGGASIVIFEQWMQTGEQALLDQIDAYNREDCIATRLLRDWLLERRDEALAQFGPFPLPEPKEARPIPEVKEVRAELRAELLDAGEELAAQLLDYHDRERKPIWWAYFDRIEMTPEELVEDPESIAGLTVVGEPSRVDRSLGVHAQLPAAGAQDPEGQQTVDPRHARSPGSDPDVDREARRLTLKRGPQLDDVRLPEAILPKSAYNTPDQEDALMRLGRSLLAGDRRYPALESILRREPFDRSVQTSDLDEMKELVLSLDERHLVIQGPPGSGKTWTSGRLIAHLIANGKSVGVASTSHKAIHNLLDAVVEAAAELGLDFDGRKKASTGNPESLLRPRRDRGRRARRTSASTPTSPPARPGSSRARTQHGRLPLRRRGRAGLARRRARDGDGGAERRPRRRPAAARPGDPGDAPVRQRRLGAAAPARRRRDRAARPRPLPRAHLPAPSGHLRVHLGGVLRGAARAGAGRGRADDAARDGSALPRGRARGAPAGVGGGGRGRARRDRAAARGRDRRT